MRHIFKPGGGKASICFVLSLKICAHGNMYKMLVNMYIMIENLCIFVSLYIICKSVFFFHFILYFILQKRFWLVDRQSAPGPASKLVLKVGQIMDLWSQRLGNLEHKTTMVYNDHKIFDALDNLWR